MPATSPSPRPPSAQRSAGSSSGTPGPLRSVTSTRTTPSPALTATVTVSPGATEPLYRTLLPKARSPARQRPPLPRRAAGPDGRRDRVRRPALALPRHDACGSAGVAAVAAQHAHPWPGDPPSTPVPRGDGTPGRRGSRNVVPGPAPGAGGRPPTSRSPRQHTASTLVSRGVIGVRSGGRTSPPFGAVAAMRRPPARTSSKDRCAWLRVLTGPVVRPGGRPASLP